MRNILLYTATGAQNLGDEHILAEEVRYLGSKYPEAKICIATYDATETARAITSLLKGVTPEIKYVPYFPYAIQRHPLQNIRNLFQNIRATWQADLVVIGGGGLFYDSEQGQNFCSQKWGWGIRLFIIQLFRKPLFYWSIGVDLTLPNLRSVSWWFTYSRAVVTVREAYSQSLLSTIGVEAGYIADPVFLYTPPAVATGTNSDRRRVGIALRP